MLRFFPYLIAMAGLIIGVPPAHASKVIPLATDGATVASGTTGLCIGCSVSQASRVINADLSDQASITLPLGVGGAGYLEVRFPSARPAVGRIGFLMTDGGGLVDVTLLGGLTLTTYLGSTPRETAGPASLRLHEFPSEPGRSYVFFRPTQTFDRVRVTVAGAATLLRNVGVAYALHSLPEATPELRYLRRGQGATATADVSSLCVGCSVTDVPNVVGKVADYATLRIPVGVAGTASVTVRADEVLGAGTRVGFRFTDEVGLVSATLLGGLRLTTYLDGVAQETATGADLRLSERSRSSVSFTPTQPYDAVRLQAEGLVTLLVELHVHAAFVITRIPLDDDFAVEDALDAADRLESIEADGATTSDALAGSLTEALRLDAPFPNPTSGGSSVVYALPQDAAVHLTLVDALGREVAVLEVGWQTAGIHRATVPSGLAPGLYLVRLSDGTGSVVRRLTVTR